jgi:hypothetical protein
MSREREIIRHARDGTAGVGVSYDPEPAPHETKVTVEQLWDDGRAEPVYVQTDDIPDLIHELMMVHMGIMDGDS